MPVIIIRQRTADKAAFIKGTPEKWGCGATINEAVGDLVRSHIKDFGITIEHEPKIPTPEQPPR
jgi:hypothetical protein